LSVAYFGFSFFLYFIKIVPCLKSFQLFDGGGLKVIDPKCAYHFYKKYFNFFPWE